MRTQLNLNKMKRTPRELYDYETKRIDKYLVEMSDIINNNIKNDVDADRLNHLIEWYGNARAIKSKAYQEMKMTKLKDKWKLLTPLLWK